MAWKIDQKMLYFLEVAHKNVKFANAQNEIRILDVFSRRFSEITVTVFWL